jgi:hypothetical protein
LLGGSHSIEANDGDTSITTTDRSIACLSVRFPLDFDFSDPDARHLVRKQVERHMRLCTTAASGFEELFSIVGSEPLLAEAASHIMADSKTSPIRELSIHMDKNCINHGERGELVAALLVMQARDAPTTASNRRWVFVPEFIEKLPGASARTVGESKLLSGKDPKPLNDRFENARMWFNHALKLQKADLINVKHLWKFITRGAIILCANNQPGVDIILPVLYLDDDSKPKALSHQTVTAILIQVKNSASFRKNIRSYLFDAMDPFEVKLFDSTVKPLPIIRIVFALASDENVVKHVPRGGASRSTRSKGRDTFTSYDLWCAGMSRVTFPAIGDDSDEASYRKLLDCTISPGKKYYDVNRIHWVTYPKEVADRKAELLRSFNPLVEVVEGDQDVGASRPAKGESQRKGKERAT